MNDKSRMNWIVMSDSAIARQIGAFVRYNRVEQSKTQEMLARDAGISRSTLSLLERGETVTVATLIQVLRVLDQLHVFDGFIVNSQPSPLMLAKAEMKKRQRVTTSRKTKKDNHEETDW